MKNYKNLLSYKRLIIISILLLGTAFISILLFSLFYIKKEEVTTLVISEEIMLNRKVSVNKNGEITTSWKNPITEKTTNRFTLQLTNDLILKYNDNYIKIYDFKKDLIIFINHEQKTFKQYPIHSIVSYKQIEKTLRERISQAYKIALGDNKDKNLDDRCFDQFNLDMLFATSKDKNHYKNLISSKNDEHEIFKLNGDKIAEFKLSKFTVSQNNMDMYLKYFLYENMMHPIIISKLLDKGLIFSDLYYKTFPFFDSEETKKYKVLSIDYDKKLISYTIPENYQEVLSYNDRLKDIQLSFASKKNKFPDYQKCIESAEKEIGTDNIIEGFLIMNKCILTYKMSIEDYKKIYLPISENPAIKNIIKINDKSLSYEEAKNIINNLPQLQRDHDYILKIYLANKIKLADTNKSFDYLFEALRKDPFITGVYHDLGELFLISYDADNAFICWSMAEAISPEFSMNDSIRKYKRKLEHEFPDHFIHKPSTKETEK